MDCFLGEVGETSQKKQMSQDISGLCCFRDKNWYLWIEIIGKQISIQK